MNQKINESALLKRGEQAAAQLEQVQIVLAQRGQSVVGTVIDGLSYLVASARTGDIRSRAVVRQVAELLKEIQSMGGIALPGD